MPTALSPVSLRVMLAALICAGGLFALPGMARAAGGGTVKGKVTGGGAALAGASVEVLGTGKKTKSGADGAYTLSDVPVGTHTVECKAAGYRTDKKTVTVAAGATATLDFALAAVPKTEDKRSEREKDVGKKGGEGSPPPPAPAAEPARPATRKAKEKPAYDLDAAGSVAGSGRGSAAGSADAEESIVRARPDPEPRAGDRGPAGGPAPRPTAVSAPAMKAGRHDDNKEYNRFLQFLGENPGLVVYPVDIAERLVVRALDKDGKSLPNCAIEVKNGKGGLVAKSVTYADGRTHFFPLEAKTQATDADYVVQASCGKQVRSGQLSRGGRRETEVRFLESRTIPKPVPVDIAILMDTTGSMGSQIDRLKQTLQSIHFQLTELATKPDLRFALVAYKDRGDTYVTQVTGFTGDVDAFQTKLDALDADGGGDTPEDLQAALEAAMHELKWRPDALRLGFVIADAIPHTDYGQPFNYREAMREALARGIKWTMIGAGGLPRAGEVIFRQIAQLTMGEYVFVTDSAAGDRDGGVGEASHHVGTNYQTENLDQAILRIVRRELSYLTDEPKDFDDTIVAQGDKTTPKELVLAPAVGEVLRQLADYSSLRLSPGTPVAIVPVTVNDDGYKAVAGYLTDEITLAVSRNATFKVVERDLQVVASELKVQLSELFDPTAGVPIGKMLGAEVMIVAKLTVTGDKAQLFAKLIRVETGEMLSVAKASLIGGVVKRS